MNNEGDKKKKWKSRILNFIFFATAFVLIIYTPARSWLLRIVLATGLFNPSIKNTNDTAAASAIPLTFVNESGIRTGTEALKGKVVFINFWASWCPPCRAEMASINNMAEKLKNNKEVVIVLINLDEEIKKGKDYLKNNFPQLPFYRAEGFIPEEMFEGTLPTTVILNQEGRIVMKHKGMANYNAEKFLKQLESLK